MKKLTTLILCSGMVFGLAAPASAEQLTAAENWRQSCQRCHGADGSGSTRLGQRLRLKDYRDPEVQKAMSDERILEVIRDGIQTEDGEEVKAGYADKMSEEEIEALLEHIRKMAENK